MKSYFPAFFKAFLSIFLLLLLEPVNAQVSIHQTSQGDIQEELSNPKIGLVLSGGGARGAAHIGVIKVLEEQNIKVDYITGTSMGALVGGLYASGLSADEIEMAVVGSNWKTFLQNDAPRADRPFRRKQDDLGFLVDFDLGINKQGLIFPKGFVQGQNLEMVIRRLTLPVATIKDFDKLPIPFRSIATDLGSGEAYVFKSGDLATSIRASMSLPGILKPVEHDGRVLVDGGVVNNLPVQIAHDMGADVLIIVDIGFPLEDTQDLNTAIDVTRQMLTIMMAQRTQEQLSRLHEYDILIKPELGKLGTLDFHRQKEAMDKGEAKARELLGRLSKLGVTKQSYSAFREKIENLRMAAPVIKRVVIENESRLSPLVIKERLSDFSDKPLDVDVLEKDIADVYAFDTFESVSYHLDESSTGTELHVVGTEKAWGPNYIQFGLNLEDDFKGASDYNLATRLTSTELNGLGGELRLEAQLGESPHLFADFYQPLDYASRWFVNPSARIGQDNSILFDNGNRTALFRSKEKVFSLAAGRNFGNWGEFRVAYNWLGQSSSLRIGDPESTDLLGGSGKLNNVHAQFGADTVDSFAIPKSGLAFNLAWTGVRESLGADTNFDFAGLFFLKPQTWGRHTLLHWWDAAAITKDYGNTVDSIELGGLFSLSGYAPGEVSGKSGGIGRLLYYYQLNDTTLSAFTIPIYFGASIEGVYLDNDLNLPEHNELIGAGSVFVMADTIIGPVYLGYGASENDHSSVYLFLGQSF